MYGTMSLLCLEKSKVTSFLFNEIDNGKDFCQTRATHKHDDCREQVASRSDQCRIFGFDIKRIMFQIEFVCALPCHEGWKNCFLKWGRASVTIITV